VGLADSGGGAHDGGDSPCWGAREDDNSDVSLEDGGWGRATGGKGAGLADDGMEEKEDVHGLGGRGVSNALFPSVRAQRRIIQLHRPEQGLDRPISSFSPWIRT